MRKTLLIVLPLLLISFSFNQEPINYETKLIRGYNLFYSKNTKQPYSGPVFFLYDGGKKKEEGNLKDGKKDKLWIGWYENGKKSFEGVYKDGNPNGLLTWWYENGLKRQEGTYKDNILISQKHWTEDGLDNGEFILFYKNGDILLRGDLKDNKFEGEFIEYGYFGTKDIYHKHSLRNYRDGKLHGEFIRYFDTGDVNMVGNYIYGNLEGNYTYYDKDGKIYWEGTYDDDVLINETSYIGFKGPFRLN